MSKKILLSHGSGGKQTNELISNIFIKYFGNTILNKMNDAAHLDITNGKIAFTTDSFVVNPIFFTGGDIGKLAVCGTVNDLAVSGAKPLYLSSAFIIEEGFELDKLETIVKSMAAEAEKAGIEIVAGDTKVVEKGSVDGVFINTTGIGAVYNNIHISADNAKPGDVVIINGTLADHGMTIMCSRHNLGMEGNLSSDCAPLNSLIDTILETCSEIHVMRDATRGGVAAVLNEIATASEVSIMLNEEKIPVKEEIRGICEMLGLDPLYVANEGKLCLFVPESCSEKVLEVMKKHPLGKDACIIGKVIEDKNKRVYMETMIGSTRIVDMPYGEQLPRIC